jgi:hypothetical protein
VNGVYISDVTHKFAEEEWNKLPVFIGGADVTVKKIPTPIQIISLKKI